MPGACELLTVAGQEVLTAAQRISVEGFTLPARKHLIRAARDVLEGTLKVRWSGIYSIPFHCRKKTGRSLAFVSQG